MRRVGQPGSRFSERTVVAKSSAYREVGDLSPDGRFIAFASTERNGNDYDIYTANLQTGSVRLVARGQHGFYANRWQPNGPNIVATETRGEAGNNLYLVNTDTGATRVLFKPQGGDTPFPPAGAVAHRGLSRAVSSVFDTGSIDGIRT